MKNLLTLLLVLLAFGCNHKSEKAEIVSQIKSLTTEKDSLVHFKNQLEINELLGKECLIAYCEDGHISGRAIYSYEFKNGSLDFKLIASFLE